MKRIGVFTSGGDAPGMNAAIRAVVRKGLLLGLEVVGIYRGYEGMIDNEMKIMQRPDVSNIIHRGGTVLKSARSDRFRTKEGRAQAFANLQERQIEGLVAIGGDGTFKGAEVFGAEYGVPIVGIAGTIDNDLYGTDFTIGYDTAINTAMEAVDRIKDTANAHDRIFVVEVMGRDAGFIALSTGIATGADAILIPESHEKIETVFDALNNTYQGRESSNIIVVAEGDESGGAYRVAELISAEYPQYEVRVSILGHIQRGGHPTCMERVRATRLGAEAVDQLVGGAKDVMLGVIDKKTVLTPFSNAIKHHHEINHSLIHLVDVLG